MNFSSLTSDELSRVITRNHSAMRALSERVGSLTLENAELMSIVQELQTDLAEARQLLADVQQGEQTLGGNGPMPVMSEA